MENGGGMGERWEGEGEEMGKIGWEGKRERWERNKKWGRDGGDGR